MQKFEGFGPFVAVQDVMIFQFRSGMVLAVKRDGPDIIMTFEKPPVSGMSGRWTARQRVAMNELVQFTSTLRIVGGKECFVENQRVSDLRIVGGKEWVCRNQRDFKIAMRTAITILGGLKTPSKLLTYSELLAAGMIPRGVVAPMPTPKRDLPLARLASGITQAKAYLSA